MAHSVKETWRIVLTLEVVDAELVERRALPAIEAARSRRKLGPLRALAREVAREVDGLEQARLEAALVADPEGDEAFEELAWALLAAGRMAPPVCLGEEWDLLRALLDPARRREGGIARVASSAAGEALVGSGPLETRTGFALARKRSYATKWVAPRRVPAIARALARWTPARVHRELATLPADLAVYPARRRDPRARARRVEESLRLLLWTYETARDAGAGVFLELAIEGA